MQAFNEYGTPNEQIQKAGDTIYRLSKALFDELLANGASPTEIRAAGGYLSSSADLASSTSILQHNAKEWKARKPLKERLVKKVEPINPNDADSCRRTIYCDEE